MTTKKSMLIFCFAFILALIYWRLKVFLFYRNGSLGFLRNITGLKIHHYHIGIIILTISLLLYLFYKKNNMIIAFLGFGLGSVLDGFSSGLFYSNSRIDEINNYNSNLPNSLLIFGIIIVFCIIFYIIRDIKQKN